MIVFIKKKKEENDGTLLKLQNRFFMHLQLRMPIFIKYCFPEFWLWENKIALRESLKLHS